MSEQEINIEIARKLGLERLAPFKRYTRKGKEDPNGVVWYYCSEDHGGAKTYERVPNYCGDLNAMRKAEMSVSDEHFSVYGWMLLDRKNIECREFLSASALRRAVVFLASFDHPAVISIETKSPNPLTGWDSKVSGVTSRS